MKDNDKILEHKYRILEDDNMVLDEDVILPKQDEIFVDDENILLSNHIKERRGNCSHEGGQNK